MYKYLSYLNKLSVSISAKCSYLVPLVRKYITGKISDYELCNSIEARDIFVFYMLINKVLNYREDDIRYYIELPRDEDFSTLYPKGIFVGKKVKNNIECDKMKLLGPSFMRLKLDSFESSAFTEIRGNFEKLANGTMISTSDWLKIILKYPDIFEYVVNLKFDDSILNLWSSYKKFSSEEIKEHMIAQIDDKINKKDEVIPQENWYAYSCQSELPIDVIDSIEFVNEKIYVSIEQICERNFGTFNDLVYGKANTKHAKILTFPK